MLWCHATFTLPLQGLRFALPARVLPVALMAVWTVGGTTGLSSLTWLSSSGSTASRQHNHLLVEHFQFEWTPVGFRWWVRKVAATFQTTASFLIFVTLWLRLQSASTTIFISGFKWFILSWPFFSFLNLVEFKYLVHRSGRPAGGRGHCDSHSDRSPQCWCTCAGTADMLQHSPAAPLRWQRRLWHPWKRPLSGIYCQKLEEIKQKTRADDRKALKLDTIKVWILK